MKDKKIFKADMEAAAEALGAKITKSLLKTYWKALDEFTNAEVAKALEALIKSKTYFPRPALIIESIHEAKKRGIPELPTVCAKCGSKDLVPNEDLCKNCYGVVDPGPEYFKKLYVSLENIGKEF